jgi:hypothetical protein
VNSEEDAMVSKQIQPIGTCSSSFDAEVRRLAPDAAVTPVVMYDDEKIQRHEDCPGVGRVRWYVRYVLPAADSSARALKPILDAAMVRWQQRYDLGVTYETAA